jgi:RNA-directed DNA polymerase
MVFHHERTWQNNSEGKQMTVDTFQEIEVETGAPSHPIKDWSEIDWQKVQEEVRRLQARIVKATQEGRWGKVKALQHLLTHSFSGKALAVRRVTENQGKRTPGVDRITWNTPEQKTRAVQTMQRRGYRPQPLRRVYIPKSNGKMRPLGIPTMADRAMQALYLLALDPIAETTGDPNSYGFRPNRSAADAREQCFNALARKGAAEWILEGDIKSCFDRTS